MYAAASVLRYRLTSLHELSLTPAHLAKGDPNEEEFKIFLAADRERADKLKKDNLYAPAPPPRNPVGQVLGIMGNEALINGQWYKVDAKIGDATIVAITADAVTVEWKGQKTEFSPINGQGGASGPAGPPGRPPGGPPPGMPPNVVISSGPPGSSVGPPPISPEEMERLKSLPPEERRAFIEARMKNMSR